MKRILTLIIVFMLLIQTPVFGEQENLNDEGDAKGDVVGEISLEDVAEEEQYKFNFEEVAQNDEAKLLIDKSSNLLRVVSLKTGNYFDTKVVNGQVGSENVKNCRLSS